MEIPGLRCVEGSSTSKPWLVATAPIAMPDLQACAEACACAAGEDGLSMPEQFCAARGLRLATPEELGAIGTTEAHCAADAADAEALSALTGAWPGWRPETPPHSPLSWYAEDPVYRRYQGQELPNWRASVKDADHSAALLRRIHEEEPGLTELHELGRSHQNRPLLALRITDPTVPARDKPTVLLNGAHHGDELLTIDYAFDAIERILATPEWLRTLDIWVVPVVNPDGVWHTMFVDHGTRIRDGGRKNARIGTTMCGEQRQRGVDLNRNYPYKWMEAGSSDDEYSWKYGGPGPASEPEVQTMMDLADAQRFVASITWHTFGSSILRPYTIPDTRNPEPDVAREVAELMRPPTFTVKTAMYAVSGTDQDWLYHEHGTLAFLLEGDDHNPVPSTDRLASVDSARPALDGLLNRVVDGPRVYGFVEHESPEKVEIRIEGYQTFEGERWTARPDGRFDRLVIGDGPFTVVAEAPDGGRAQATVRLDELPVLLVLP